MDVALIQGFHALFIGLERAHGEYVIGAAKKDVVKKKGKANTVQKPVTNAVWKSHLEGNVGLGVVPINDDNTCRWGAIDVDIYENFDVAKFASEIDALGLPLVVCRTKSGGAHLYLFTSEPVPAELLRKKLKEISIALKLPDEEIFPKQDELTPADIGNWINMPYFDCEMTTRYAIEKGKSCTAERFLEYAESRKVTLRELNAITVTLPSDEFDDGPPCLQYLAAAGFPQGSRNNALFSLGVYARRKFEDSWEEKVFEYNQTYMGPGTYAEVKAIIRALSKRSYFYKCTDQPLCQACNKDECRKRTYGITGKESKEDGPCVLDEVDRPIKVYIPVAGSNDEPMWIFKISGKAFDVTVDMVRDQDKFLKAYLVKFHKLLLLVKHPTWAHKMNELLAEAEVLELPPDAGPEGQFLQHLEAFCTGKVQARVKDELLLGKPWTENGSTYFRSKDLMKYLDQQHFREYKERQVWPILKRHGAQHEQFMLKGSCVACWYVPEYIKQTEDFDVPIHAECPF